MQWSVKRKKRAGGKERGREGGGKNYILHLQSVAGRSRSTLVIESVPRLGHKGVGKANHVDETRGERELEERERE